jgi:hypothetical protein
MGNVPMDDVAEEALDTEKTTPIENRAPLHLQEIDGIPPFSQE